MTPPKVLVTAPRAVAEISRYESALGAAGCEVVHRASVERLSETELLPLVTDVDGMVCGDDAITGRVLDSAARLRVICKWGTGMDSIDVAGALARGIVVRNSPGAFTDPVADTVLGYVLLFARGLDRMAADMRAGLWRRVALRALNECTIGIVGLGATGSAVARRAAACGMRVVAATLDAAVRAEPSDQGPELVPMERLLAISDFITLHADMRPGNRRLIAEAELARMKPSAVLINTARGALVDEPALVDALLNGRLAGAALDVFEEEPLPQGSPLRSMANVYLAPHNANASAAAADRVHANCIDGLLRVLYPTEHG